jgi:hypothetical protein
VAYKQWACARGRKAELNSTWKYMLGISHRYNTKYYTPLIASLELFLGQVSEHRKSYKKNPQSDETLLTERLAFFYLVRFRQRNREVVRAIGGFYFKNNTGENLAAHCLDSFRRLYLGPEESAQLENFAKVLHNVSKDETFEEFQLKLEGRATVDSQTAEAFKDSWRHFDRWIRSDHCSKACVFLRAARPIIYYEMNRPYEYWYGKRVALTISAESITFLQSMAEQLGPPEYKKRLLNEVTAYLEEGRGLS